MSGSDQTPSMAVNTMPSIHRVLPPPLPPNTSTVLLPRQFSHICPPAQLLISDHRSGSTIFTTSYLGRPSIPIHLDHLLAHLLPKKDAQQVPPCPRVAGSIRIVQLFLSRLKHSNTLSSKLLVAPCACPMSRVVVCLMAPRPPRLKLAEVLCFRA